MSIPVDQPLMHMPHETIGSQGDKQPAKLTKKCHHDNDHHIGWGRGPLSCFSSRLPTSWNAGRVNEMVGCPPQTL